MRTSDLAPALALLLAACGGSGVPDADGNGPRNETVAKVDETIECALDGGANFRRDCTAEPQPGEGGLLVTVRRPDGGFHRLRVTDDGRGVVAADGAEEARVAVVGAGTIEVTIGRDRYRLPATVGSRKGG